MNEALNAARLRCSGTQDPIDQRHAYDVALRVRVRLATTDRGALLQRCCTTSGRDIADIGATGQIAGDSLRCASLPNVGGVAATTATTGPLGAADLAAIGAVRCSIAFANGEIDRRSNQRCGTCWWRLMMHSPLLNRCLRDRTRSLLCSSRTRKAARCGGVGNSMPRRGDT